MPVLFVEHYKDQLQIYIAYASLEKIKEKVYAVTTKANIYIIFAILCYSCETGSPGSYECPAQSEQKNVYIAEVVTA